MEGFSALSPQWGWLAIGLVLAAAEMAMPGLFLIWLAGAAIVTGLVCWAFPIGLPVQIVLFAVLAIASVFVGKRWLAANPVIGADPQMNDRGARLVGQIVMVTQPIELGSGRVKVGDSEWLAHGPDAAAGTRVRIAGHDGAILLVEAVI